MLSAQLLKLKKANDELKKKKQCKLCTDDLLQKYCVLRYKSDLAAYRREAMDNNWMRHWEGKRKEQLLGESEGPQFDWEGTTQSMAKFQNYLVERFILQKKEQGDGDIYDGDGN
eukprot:gene30323-39551_t